MNKYFNTALIELIATIAIVLTIVIGLFVAFTPIAQFIAG